MSSFDEGLRLLQDVQQGAEDLGVENAHASGLDSAIRTLGTLGVLFNGLGSEGFRYQGFDAEAGKSVIGSHPRSVGPGLIMKTPGNGKRNPSSEMVRGARLSTGPYDTPEFFYAWYTSATYDSWDSTSGYDNTDLQISVPLQANVGYVIFALGSVGLYAGNVGSTVSSRITIGSDVTTGAARWNGDAGIGSQSYAQRGVTQWSTTMPFHARYLRIDNPAPSTPYETALVKVRCTRSGTAATNRLGESSLIVVRIPV